MHLDRRLTWKSHIWAKRKQLGLKFRNMYWLLGKKSQLSLNNKVLLYKTILKPIWTYGIQLWGAAKKTNIEVIQRFQSKVLRCISDAPWFTTNETIHNFLGIKMVVEVITDYAKSHVMRLQTHPNRVAKELLKEEDKRRLKRFRPSDLPLRKY